MIPDRSSRSLICIDGFFSLRSQAERIEFRVTGVSFCCLPIRSLVSFRAAESIFDWPSITFDFSQSEIQTKLNELAAAVKGTVKTVLMPSIVPGMATNDEVIFNQNFKGRVYSYTDKINVLSTPPHTDHLFKYHTCCSESRTIFTVI